MTSRVSLFDHPFFLGFDHFERELDRLKKTTDSYPPYNVEQTGEHGLRITLAVAGFTMNDLEVEAENNQLTIRGRQQEEEGRLYLHRGIAARQFQRSFVLADGIEITGASLDNGLLHIDMVRRIPESKARKIEISGKNAAALANGHHSPTAIDVDTVDKRLKKEG
jgi:HSP20 family molecular chaperone IbpA